ncbi:MAG: class I SAM-dependent methyltransferase [Candidatus Micrarchaeota archaeon]|nr:class I SAM-dependent methyltransferase [Candidatus Micrarchaeota archaeon]
MAGNNPGLWSREYARRGVPSSFRDTPSDSVVYFLEFLKSEGLTKGRALDIGSGKGRNSIFMARKGFEVDSIDFVPEMTKELESRSRELGLSDTIHAHCSDVSRPWRLETGHFDIAIDTFCYSHQVKKSEKDTYIKELARVMKPRGFYLLTLSGADDGYYGMFLKSPSKAKEIVDPVNSIPMMLYEKKDIESEFNGRFRLSDYVHKQHRNMMHGTEYNRSTHLFIFRKK